MRQFHPASMPMSPVNHRIEDAEQGVSPVENGPTSRKRSTRACDVSLAFQVGPQLMAGVQGVSPALAGVSTLTSQEAPKMRGPQSRRGVGAGYGQALSGWAGGLHVHCAGTEEVRGRPRSEQLIMVVLTSRGPVPGSTRAPKKIKSDDPSSSESASRMSKPKAVSPVAAMTPAKRNIAPEPTRERFLREAGSRTISPPIMPSASGSRPSGRPPLLGLPRAMVDDLLAVYFTHVHVRATLYNVRVAHCRTSGH